MRAEVKDCKARIGKGNPKCVFWHGMRFEAESTEAAEILVAELNGKEKGKRYRVWVGFTEGEPDAGWYLEGNILERGLLGVFTDRQRCRIHYQDVRRYLLLEDPPKPRRKK